MKLFTHVLPYLLLLSFYSGQLNNFDREKIQAINESPYNGVAVSFIGRFDTGKYNEDNFEEAVRLLKKESKKHIWPWVSFSRFVGYKEDSNSASPLAQNEYFKKIKGMDIFNETGALEDFKNIWRLSLRLAKQLDAPGILVDPEPYNNYKTYEISYLANQLGKTKKVVRRRLEEIGSELADIAAEEYPEATLWFLFTGLGNPVRNLEPFADREYRTVTYIIQGMLERAEEKTLKFKFISGGEISLGYCYKSADDQKQTIKKRNSAYAPVLLKYPNLYLGGTISPWDKMKKDWMLKDKCGESSLKNINDFSPLFEYLFISYSYIWIYAAGAAEYNPYDSNVSAKVNFQIEKALRGNH